MKKVSVVHNKEIYEPEIEKKMVTIQIWHIQEKIKN